MRLEDFDYELPKELIAQKPAEPRDHSRLLVLHRDGGMEHRMFYELPEYLGEGDVLVFNRSRVIPARLKGYKETGAKMEILLIREVGGKWEALIRPSRKVRIGVPIRVGEYKIEVLERKESGLFVLEVPDGALKEGEIPLPPYIRTKIENPERYQTIFADRDGSIASPTAGLHFTENLISRIKEKGVRIGFITLHISLDTFRPIKNAESHKLYKEYCEVDEETVRLIKGAKRVICVGTTVVRALETCALEGEPRPFFGFTELFIKPGFEFKVTDALITNFHLPRTTLLMLVCAFAGREKIMRAYEEAKKLGYRFYSFGDAMLIL